MYLHMFLLFIIGKVKFLKKVNEWYILQKREIDEIKEIYIAHPFGFTGLPINIH